MSDALPSLDQVLRLFDETTHALSAQIRRLEEVLTQKQAELVAANTQLAEKVGLLDHMTRWLELVLGSVASGVIAVDSDGIVTTANDAAIAIFSGVLDDPIGANWRESFADSPLLAVLGDGVTRRYERTVGRRLVACSGAPVRASDGTIIGAVEVSEDITELRRLRDVAERADRLKHIGEVAAGVAHEIRNPLTGIGGFASLLEREFSATGDARDQRCHRYARLISTGVTDLNSIVSGMIEYTRPRPAQKKSCDAGQLTDDVVALVLADCPPGVRVTYQGPASPLIAQADAGQIRQVLLNVIRNAMQAVSEHGDGTGEVLVSCESGGSTPRSAVQWIVEDSGPGIAPELAARLFTPFATGRDHGTGLGLAISHVLMQGHGGSLSVDRSPRLRGARFRAEIP